MDLITQTVIVAAVGEVVLGKKDGNKAIMWGAIGGLIPDLDVLILPFFSEFDGCHRSERALASLIKDFLFS